MTEQFLFKVYAETIDGKRSELCIKANSGIEAMHIGGLLLTEKWRITDFKETSKEDLKIG